MNNLKWLLMALTFFSVITSCEKSTTCEISCENSGTKTDDCGCDCPPGYGGQKCETAVAYAVKVDVDNTKAYAICPTKYNGDNDFANGIYIYGTIALELTHNDTRVYGVVEAQYAEINGDTRARINGSLTSNRILLYTAPTGKKVVSINGVTSIPFSTGALYGTPGSQIRNFRSFVFKIEMIGNTSGADLPCDGSTSYSRFRVWFDDFYVTLANK